MFIYPLAGQGDENEAFLQPPTPLPTHKHTLLSSSPHTSLSINLITHVGQERLRAE